MKKIFPILLLSMLLLFFNTVATFGNAFRNTYSIEGGSINDRVNIQFEYNINSYLSWYADYYKLEKYNSSFTTTIVGMTYYFKHRANNKGWYISGGIPLFKDVDYNPATSESGKNIFRSAYNKDFDVRLGCRMPFIPNAKFTPYFDAGFSYIKIAHCDIGVSF